jgi:hypothetical protein
MTASLGQGRGSHRVQCMENESPPSVHLGKSRTDSSPSAPPPDRVEAVGERVGLQVCRLG